MPSYQFNGVDYKFHFCSIFEFAKKLKLTGIFQTQHFRIVIGGWGATVENGTASLHLLGVNLTVIPKHICNAQNSYGGMVKSNMFCAGAMDGGRDSCQGDSGGGLICNTYLSGIVSFGYG